MRTRHRPPSIFSMSMLDVLCCSLGAVILLLLLNFGLTRQRASALTAAQAQLKQADNTLTTRRAELDQALAKLAETEQALAALQTSSQEASDTSTKRQEAMAVAQAALLGRIQSIERDLARTRRLLEQAQADRAAAEKLLATGRDEAQATADALKRELAAANALLGTSEKDKAVMANQVPTLRRDLEAAQNRAAALEADLLRLKKQAEDAGLKLAAVEKDKHATEADAATLRKLLDDQQATSGRLRLELQQAAQRFAGVDLSGQRVVLLVDCSGSMAAVDAQTQAPNKWPTVCDAVAQVLKSLPRVEKFQVVLFSDDVTYALGQPGQWLDYDRAASAEAVRQALLKVPPKGNTNLYAAFDAAFRLKPQGLDTIFVFSDGLPNIGPGLPANPPKDEAAQAALLGTHLLETIRTRWNAADPKVRIHGIGFFYESPNLGAFLWSLSRANGGNFVGMSRP